MRTAEVARLLGRSYRQVDYLTRRDPTLLPEVTNLGSGVRRVWPDHVVDKLLIACTLDTALPGGALGLWPTLVDAVMAAGDPPAEGWVVYSKDVVTYAATPSELVSLLTAKHSAFVAAI